MDVDTTDTLSTESVKDCDFSEDDVIHDIKLRSAIRNHDSTISNNDLPTDSDTLQGTNGQVAENEKYPEDFKAVDFGLCLFSGILFILDYAINLSIFQKYYRLHKNHDDFLVYCYLTLIFSFSIPLITAVFEVVWYAEEKTKYGKGLKWYQWLLRIIIMILLLGPAFRYVEVLMFAHNKLLKANTRKQKQKVVKQALEMKADADFLYMLEKFTESGLHIVLQILIVKRELPGEDHETIGIGEVMKIIIAAILMPYSVTIFLRSQRQANEDENNMSCMATIVHFFWRFLIIIPQAITLSFFLAMFPLAFMITTICTYGIMAIWVFVQNSIRFCKQVWLEAMFKFLVAFIYLFSYFNIMANDSYYRSLFYYSFMFLERGLMICFWCQGDADLVWYRWPILTIFFVSFIGGMILQVIYYKVFHPTRANSKGFQQLFTQDTGSETLKGTSSRENSMQTVTLE